MRSCARAESACRLTASSSIFSDLGAHRAVLAHQRGGHLSVAVDAGIGPEAVSLALTRGLDPLAVVGRRQLVLVQRGDLSVFERLGLERNVDAIEERSTDPGVVIGDAELGAGADSTVDIEVTTWTRVHRGNEHHAAGGGDVLVGSRVGYLLFLV